MLTGLTDEIVAGLYWIAALPLNTNAGPSVTLRSFASTQGTGVIRNGLFERSGGITLAASAVEIGSDYSSSVLSGGGAGWQIPSEGNKPPVLIWES
jgi:hypothetical protein